MLAGMMAGGAAPAWAGAPVVSPRPVRRPGIPEAAELIARAKLGGQVAFVVADARSGAVLESANPDLSLPPASVAKVVTALYALEVLGPEFRFVTRIVATGPVEDGVLYGDLGLVGAGDPVLDTDMLGTLAERLAATGLRRVEGRFLYYAGALPRVPRVDPLQPEHLGYNPSVSGLNLNFNRVHFEWRQVGQGYDIALDARAERFRPPVGVARMRVVDRDLPVYTYSSKESIDDWTVARGALGRGGTRWLPVRVPALYAAEVFRVLAQGQGVKLSAPVEATVRPPGPVLAQHHGDGLVSVLRGMLKYSTNLTAEAVGLRASLARGEAVPDLSASARAMSEWAGGEYGMKSSGFADHSGLGETSRVTAEDLVRVLVRVGPRGPLKPLLKPFDLKGRAAGGEVGAKTGTLNFVSALAGYAQTPGGRDLAFAILSADLPRRAALSRAEREYPEGGRAWIGRARTLQRDLLARWGSVYRT